MPVITGLGIPKGAPDRASSEKLIEYLTQPQTQITTLTQLAFFPATGAQIPSELPAGVKLEADAVANRHRPEQLAGNGRDRSGEVGRRVERPRPRDGTEAHEPDLELHGPAGFATVVLAIQAVGALVAFVLALRRDKALPV